MKILYHHRVVSKDGQYVHIEEMTSALRNLGHEVIMVGPRVTTTQEFGSNGGIVPFLKKRIPGHVYEFLEFGYSIYAFLKLAMAVVRHKPDIVYERYQLFMPAGVWIKKLFDLTMLLEVNAPLYEERSHYGGIALKRLARWSECYVWKSADYVLPVTHVLAKKVAKEGISAEKIVVIPNGIDPDKFTNGLMIEEAKRRLGLEGRLVLGFTGFVREWHGLEQVVDLLVGAKSEQKRHLLIVGDGPARRNIEQKARDLGVADRITITGIVYREHVADYIAAFDIALQPAVVEYASPLKLFEYLVMCKAIVAPSSANIREILTDGVNATLFDAEKKGALCDTVDQLCNDAQLRECVSKHAAETIISKKLTWPENAKKVVNIALSAN